MILDIDMLKAFYADYAQTVERAKGNSRSSDDLCREGAVCPYI